MKGFVLTALRLASVAFIVFMALAAPRGHVLGSKTVPTMHVIGDRFAHFHYSGRALCDIGHLVGLCGDVGSLTKSGVGGF